MTTAYRHFRSADEEQLLLFGERFLSHDHYLDNFSLLTVKYWSGAADLGRHLNTIPGWQEHCLLATDESDIVAALVYWPRLVRDANGEILKVGHITHLATREDRRRQGHAAQLLAIAKDELREQGYAFAMLFTKETKRTPFERLGWQNYPLPYRWGDIGSRLQRIDVKAAGYNIAEFNPLHRGWQEIAEIYDVYNRTRPFTLVRDKDYWPHFFNSRYQSWGELTIKVAILNGSSLSCGYVIGTNRGIAGYEADILEIGVLPGHEGAVKPLLYKAVHEASMFDDGISLYLPYDEVVGEFEGFFFEQVSEEIMTKTLMQSDRGRVFFDESRRLMAVPLAPGWNEARIHALCTAPGVVFWLLDDVYHSL